MQHALERNQIYIHGQPQINLHHGYSIGAEALLRWQYPKLGGVSPAEFIPFAEDGGLILPLGEWVLRCAVRQAKALIYKGFAPLIIAVNISTVKFRHTELPELVTRILAEEGLSDRNVPSAVIQKSGSLLQSEIAKRKIG